MASAKPKRRTDRRDAHVPHLLCGQAADTTHPRERVADAFRAWRQRLARALNEGGLDIASAEATAMLLLAASEGAVVISRAERDIRPFETVAEQLRTHVRNLVNDVAARHA